MSDAGAAAETEADVCCANCGIAGVDEIIFEECDAGCQFIRYCGDKCRENHREQREEECRNRWKKLLGLHDKNLLSQPEGNHLGECPLCFVPMPFDPLKSRFFSCCSQIVCYGCSYANRKNGGGKGCPFCREPRATDMKDSRQRLMKRVKANDPVALRQMGGELYREGDCVASFEYLTKAADLGDSEAHYMLGDMYWRGECVEKDGVKAVYYLEEAAIGGHPWARHNLAAIEEKNGNIERSVKHLIIGANLGHDKSMRELWKHYSAGNITKEDLDATLRANHAAINATKSSQREEAERSIQK